MGLTNRARAVLVGAGLLILGIIFQQVAILPAGIVDPAILFDIEEASRLGIMVMLPLNFIGLALAGVLYLWRTGRGWEWLDLDRPGKWDAAWVIGGTVVILLSLIVIGVIAQMIEVEPPEQGLMLLLEQDVVLILFMILIVWLINAPAEEFLFRNVIQKRLYADFSGISAVVITSVLFAGIHVLTFVLVGQELLGVMVPILAIFIGSVVMGFAYLRTANLWVPIIIHGLYNTFQLTILLISVVYDIDDEMVEATSVLLMSLL